MIQKPLENLGLEVVIYISFKIRLSAVTRKCRFGNLLGGVDTRVKTGHVWEERR